LDRRISAKEERTVPKHVKANGRSSGSSDEKLILSSLLIAFWGFPKDVGNCQAVALCHGFSMCQQVTPAVHRSVILYYCKNALEKLL